MGTQHRRQTTHTRPARARGNAARGVAALAVSAVSVAVTVLALLAAAVPAGAIPEGPEYPSAEWTTREAANFAKTRESGNEQLTDPAFQARLTEQSATNLADYTAFQVAHGFANTGNLCNHWQFTCAGDPFRYPGTDSFYDDEAVVTETLFYDRGCARISGRVWRPIDAAPGDDLPGVVITTGSVQAPETLYWWFAQALVRQGYVVMTWDVRGQGRSDTATPTGEQGSNANSSVFWDGTVDAIDFFHSTPTEPYPHNPTCAAAHAADAPLAAAALHNPFHDVLDRDRLGLAGHSLGARGVTVVQGMDPWEGQIGTENPVDVIVAWDSLSGGDDITPRVPAMGHSSEYGLVNVPFTEPPGPDDDLGPFGQWVDARLPVSQFTIQGSTHYEWSLIPTTPVANFSASSWNTWGRPMAEHFSLAWMDRWLKEPGEVGHDDADARLTDDSTYCERYSFYLRSARDFPFRSGGRSVSGDLRAACLAADTAVGTPRTETGTVEPETQVLSAGTTGTLPATGTSVPLTAALAMLVGARGAAAVRRRRPAPR